MARQNINIGTTANDGTGDKLRVAFDKVNDNFIELYELGDKGSKGDKGEPGAGGGGAGAQGAQGVQGATGAKGEVGVQGDQGAVGAQGLQGEQGVQGETGSKGEPGTGGGGASLPLANGASNIDIATANGAVTVTANVFIWTFDETNGSIDLPGNVTNFEACSAINFVANSSGDGNGYSTIELRPDSNAINDQYLIIDPTAPTHIHIRAGGQQDNANAELYLGGENSFFKVGSGENPPTSIASNDYVWAFNTDGTITFPDSTIQNTAFTGGATGAQGVQGAVGAQGIQGAEGAQGVQGAVGAQGDQGIAGAQGDQGIAGAQGDQGAAGPQGDLGAAGAQGDQGAQGTKGDKGDAGTASLPIANGSSNINIANASSNVTVTANSYTWNFNEVGHLYLPLGANNKSTITFATNPGGGAFDQADIQFYAASGENTVFEIRNRNDTADSIKLDASGPVRIVTDGDGNIGGPYSWEFSTNGAIVFPDSTVQTTAFTGAGAQGAQGVQGAAGAQGVQGHQGVQGATGSTSTIYFLEAYANETYTLPGSFTEDACRYSVVSSNVSVSNSWFDTSTYTFTPQKAGYWEITASYDVYRNAEASVVIKKNNSIVASAGSFNAVAQQITKIVYLNGSTDYISIYNFGGASLSRSQYAERSWFQARWTGE